MLKWDILLAGTWPPQPPTSQPVAEGTCPPPCVHYHSTAPSLLPTAAPEGGMDKEAGASQVLGN